MKKSEVQIGGVYVARISGKLCRVRIDAIRKLELPFTSSMALGSRRNLTRWEATNLETGRPIVIKSAAKLRLDLGKKVHDSVKKTIEKATQIRVWDALSEVLKEHGCSSIAFDSFNNQLRFISPDNKPGCATIDGTNITITAGDETTTYKALNEFATVVLNTAPPSDPQAAKHFATEADHQDFLRREEAFLKSNTGSPSSR